MTLHSTRSAPARGSGAPRLRCRHRGRAPPRRAGVLHALVNIDRALEQEPARRLDLLGVERLPDLAGVQRVEPDIAGLVYDFGVVGSEDGGGEGVGAPGFRRPRNIVI